MSEIHSKKSHDYASSDSPYANYQFAGKLSKLFDNPNDAGFIGRIAEKLYRLANLENSGKSPSNESIEDTEVDLCVIMALWVASRRERRGFPIIEGAENKQFRCIYCEKLLFGLSQKTEKGEVCSQCISTIDSSFDPIP
jgi:hypothetical protein